MKFNGFRFFFVLQIIYVLPLTSVTASGFYAPGYYPAADQFHRDYSRATQFVRPGFRPGGNRGYAEFGQWRTNYPPVVPSRYQGYQFRPFQPNYRYRPAFTLPSANHRVASYRWRPVNNQRQVAQWQNNYRRSPVEPVWGRAVSYRSAPYLTGKTWGIKPGYRQRNAEYGRGYRFRPTAEVSPEYVARHIPRAMNISIPDYYVYRPIKPKPRQALVRNAIDLKARGIDSNRASLKNVSEATHSRFPDKSINRASGDWHKVSAGWSRPGFPISHTSSPRRWRYVTDRVVMPAPLFSGNYLYVRSEYAFRHSVPRIPVGRFGYRPRTDNPPAFVAGYTPNRGSPGYLQQPATLPHGGFHSPQDVYVHTESRTNWYDGQADKEGAWYRTLQIDGESLVSQTDQDDYALTEYERINF